MRGWKNRTCAKHTRICFVLCMKEYVPIRCQCHVIVCDVEGWISTQNTEGKSVGTESPHIIYHILRSEKHRELGMNRDMPDRHSLDRFGKIERFDEVIFLCVFNVVYLLEIVW